MALHLATQLVEIRLLRLQLTVRHLTLPQQRLQLDLELPPLRSACEKSDIPHLLLAVVDLARQEVELCLALLQLDAAFVQ
jgi:hypothetical protein